MSIALFEQASMSYVRLLLGAANAKIPKPDQIRGSIWPDTNASEWTQQTQRECHRLTSRTEACERRTPYERSEPNEPCAPWCVLAGLWIVAMEFVKEVFGQLGHNPSQSVSLAEFTENGVMVISPGVTSCTGRLSLDR